jgi:hypothetical protein
MDGSKGGWWKRIRLYRESREDGHSEPLEGTSSVGDHLQISLLGPFLVILQASNRAKCPMGMIPASGCVRVGAFCRLDRPGGCVCLARGDDKGSVYSTGVDPSPPSVVLASDLCLA